jgi:hypothetical protein
MFCVKFKKKNRKKVNSVKLVQGYTDGGGGVRRKDVEKKNGKPLRLPFFLVIDDKKSQLTSR